MKKHKPKLPCIQWNSPIPDYEILSDCSCKLIYEQSKEYFNETVSESEELTQRSTRLLLFLLPGVAAVLGYCIANQDKLNPLDSFDVILLLAATGALCNCILNLFSLMSAKQTHYRGSKPIDIMRKDIFELKEILQVEKALYVSEIETYQVKIEQMEYWNYRRIKTYTEAIYAFYAMLILGIFLLIRSIYQF